MYLLGSAVPIAAARLQPAPVSVVERLLELESAGGGGAEQGGWNQAGAHNLHCWAQ